MTALLLGPLPLACNQPWLGVSGGPLLKSEGSLCSGAACFLRAIGGFAIERIFTEAFDQKKGLNNFNSICAQRTTVIWKTMLHLEMYSLTLHIEVGNKISLSESTSGLNYHGIESAFCQAFH